MERPALLAELERRADAFDPDRTWADGSRRTLSDRVWRGGQAARSQIDAVLREAIRTGEDALVTATKLEQFLDPSLAPRRDANGRLVPGQRKAIVTRSPGRGGMGSYPARRLARTEIGRAHAEATETAGRLNPFARGLQWNLSGRHPKGDECDGFAGQVYPFDRLPRMPNHPMCFPAGTVVAGPRAVASTIRWYTGDVIEIVLRGGDLLTVTPNHPILTPDGWVPAGTLHEGGDVIRSGLSERELPAVYPDHHDGPAPIQDVAVALGRASAVMAVPVPTTAEDFHGDGVGSKVCVVRTDRLLSDGVDGSIRKPSCEQQFGRRRAALALLACQRDLAPTIERVGLPARSDMGRSGPAAFVFGRDSAHGEANRVCHASAFHPGDAEAASDDIAGHAVGRGERLLGLASAIPADDLVYRQIDPCREQVVAVRRRPFVGHVYNLQTTGGWYIANGIVVHNCLCFWTQALLDTDTVVAALRVEYGLAGGPPSAASGAGRPSPSGALAALRSVARAVASALGFGREAA